jgi:hypothetical protein
MLNITISVDRGRCSDDNNILGYVSFLPYRILKLERHDAGLAVPIFELRHGQSQQTAAEKRRPPSHARARGGGVACTSRGGGRGGCAAFRISERILSPVRPDDDELEADSDNRHRLKDNGDQIKDEDRREQGAIRTQSPTG